jgi:hypothetical protein
MGSGFLSAEMLIFIAGLAILFTAAKVLRKERSRRKATAATVSLSLNPEGAKRALADGRVESARWAHLQRVEVVCTPIPTADGARSFALLAESEEVGCLVPLGVGWDDALLTHLSGRPGFRIERFSAATELRPPRRTVVWEAVPDDQVVGDGTPSD